MSRSSTSMMIVLAVLASLALLARGNRLPDVPAQALTRPNVLLLFTDDQRTDSLSFFGNEHLDTPNIDALFGRGTVFERAYCMGSRQGAVCVPSRAMLHSGTSLERVANDLSNVEPLGALLGSAGYQTFHTGKWHNGRGAVERAFQTAKSVMLGGMSHHRRVPLSDWDGQAWEDRGISEAFSTETFVDAALEFVEGRDPERPFFCSVAFTVPHDPRQTIEPYTSAQRADPPPLPANFLPQHPFNNGALVIRDEVLAAWPRRPEDVAEQLADYYAMIEHLDAELGRLFDRLEARGELDDTLIVFASDHGLALGSHGLLGKQSVYEHSMGALLAFSGPGVPAGSSDALVYLFDILPTICGRCSVDAPEGLDGRDLEPLWSAADAERREGLLLRYGGDQRAWVEPRYKLIRYPRIGFTQLFDLHEDPHEIRNLAGELEHHARVRRMAERLQAAQADFGDATAWTDPEVRRPFRIDLSGVARRPDQHQPDEVVERYFE
jgi:arylsulfatase A-like enzyme